MKIINMHDAKTQLSKLVREASSGEPFLIAKAGKPIVKVEKFEEPKEIKRLGLCSVKERFLIILILWVQVRLKVCFTRISELSFRYPYSDLGGNFTS